MDSIDHRNEGRQKLDRVKPPGKTKNREKEQDLSLRTKLLAALQTNIHLLEKLPIEIRINQLRAFEAFRKKLEDPNWDLRGYIIQPTGAGKTVLFGIFARLLNQPTVIFVPRTTLLEQTRDELIDTCGFDPKDIGIVGKRVRELGRQITIATYQSHISLKKGRNPDYLETWGRTSTVICDEAHRSLGKKTRQQLEDSETEYSNLTDEEEKAEEKALADLNNETDKIRLAFTATPQLRGKHIQSAFSTEIARESYADLARAGIVARFKVVHTQGMLKRGEDLSKGKITEKDEVAILTREDTYRKLLTKFIQARSLLKRALKTIAFCRNIDECDKFMKLAQSEFGLKCIRVTSADDTAALQEAEAGLMNGSIDIVATVDKLGEGWNFKPLEAVIRARADASPARILQGCGRAGRAYPGKEFAYIFETDWKVLSNKNSGESDRDKKRGPTYPPTGGGKSDVVYVTNRYNLIEALRDNGEEREDITDICDLTDISEAGENKLGNL